MGLRPCAATRRRAPERLRGVVRGDRDGIVIKFWKRPPSRRYETANSFAADVQRYLNDEPVQACPPSAWYRFRKFARRNKRALAAAALVAMALLVTLVTLAVSNVVIWQERDAKAIALIHAPGEGV